MAEVFAEDFIFGVAGVAVTRDNTDFSTVDADITFDDTTPLPGGTGSVYGRVAPSTSAIRMMLRNYGATYNLLYRRFYMYLPALPSAVFAFSQYRGGNTLRSNLRVQATGGLVVADGGTNVFTSPAGTIPTGQWVRVEHRLDLAAGVQQVRLFYGANLHGTTASYDTGDRAYTAGSIDQSRLGVATASTSVILFDDIWDDDTTWVGPLSGGGGGPVPLNVTSSATGSSTVTLTAQSSSLNVASTGAGTSAVSIYAIPTPPPSVLRKFHEWTMFARSVDYAPTVALPILSAQIVLRHMGVDKAIATTTYTEDRWAALGPGQGVTIWRDGRQEFTGLVAGRSLAWDKANGRTVITVDCEGDEAHLADRPVFPNPLLAADAQTVNDYWTYTGRGSTAMQRLISDQAGPTARADRQVTGLVLGDDPGIGTSRKWSALFDSEGNALGTLASIAVASGANLGLRMVAAPGSLTANITAPRNLATSAVFSADLSNLVGFNYSESVPTVTHALSAGQGDLHLRMRRLAVTANPLALQWRRQRWSYIDRRDTADAADLVTAAQDALAEGGPTVNLTVQLTDSDAASYGADWQLGDRVTVYVGLPGQPKPAVVSDVIREIFLEVDESGAETIRPAIGSYDAKAVLPTPTQRQLAAVGSELANIKRK